MGTIEFFSYEYKFFYTVVRSILDTKFVDDKYKISVTVLVILVNNIHYPFTLAVTNITMSKAIFSITAVITLVLFFLDLVSF